MFERLRRWLAGADKPESLVDPSLEGAMRLSLLFVITGFGLFRDRYTHKAPPLLAVG